MVFQITDFLYLVVWIWLLWNDSENHQLSFSNVVGYLKSKSLFFSCWWLVQSFEASRYLGNLNMYYLCTFKIAHGKSYSCSQIRQVENNKWNWNANLLKASLEETYLCETRMSDFARAITFWQRFLISGKGTTSPRAALRYRESSWSMTKDHEVDLE